MKPPMDPPGKKKKKAGLEELEEVANHLLFRGAHRSMENRPVRDSIMKHRAADYDTILGPPKGKWDAFWRRDALKGEASRTDEKLGHKGRITPAIIKRDKELAQIKRDSLERRADRKRR